MFGRPDVRAAGCLHHVQLETCAVSTVLCAHAEGLSASGWAMHQLPSTKALDYSMHAGPEQADVALFAPTQIVTRWIRTARQCPTNDRCHADRAQTACLDTPHVGKRRFTEAADWQAD